MTIKNIPLSLLKEHDENKKYFDDIKGELWEIFKEDIKKNGITEPLTVNHNMKVVKGNQRLKAARELNIKEVPCIEKTYNSFDEEIDDLIRDNVLRRDLDVFSKMKLVERMKDKLPDKRTFDNKKTTNIIPSLQNAAKLKPSDEIAETLNESLHFISMANLYNSLPDDKKQEVMQWYESQENTPTKKQLRQKIDDFKKVLEIKNELEKKLKDKNITIENYEIKLKELTEKLSQINQNNNEIINMSESKFNETNDNIEWSKWTWNPVTGCLHDCSFCYARDIANRFYKEKFTPTFHEYRLTAPINTKNKLNFPNNVFVCSMADLFGQWVKEEWIEKILNVCKNNTQWNYLFLTKNPSRYLEFNFSSNCWLGCTIHNNSMIEKVENVFKNIKNNYKFLSCEPLLEEIDINNIVNYVDWVIIGGQSKNSLEQAKQPKWEWVEKILITTRNAGKKIYFKPNLTVRPKEYIGE